MARSKKPKVQNYSKLIEIRPDMYSKQFAGFVRSIHNAKVCNDWMREYLDMEVSDKIYRNALVGYQVGLNAKNTIDGGFLSKKKSSMIVFNCFYKTPISVLGREVMIKSKENIMRMEFTDEFIDSLPKGNYSKFKFYESKGRYFIQIDLNSKRRSTKTPLKLTQEKCCRNMIGRKLLRMGRSISEAERFKDKELKKAAEQYCVLQFRNDIISSINRTLIKGPKAKPLAFDHSKTIDESKDNQLALNFILESVNSVYEKKKGERDFFKDLLSDIFRRDLSSLRDQVEKLKIEK